LSLPRRASLINFATLLVRFDLGVGFFGRAKPIAHCRGVKVLRPPRTCVRLEQQAVQPEQQAVQPWVAQINAFLERASPSPWLDLSSTVELDAGDLNWLELGPRFSL
jgi:hypothetical protein